jgi:hypothetical protein
VENEKFFIRTAFFSLHPRDVKRNCFSQQYVMDFAARRAIKAAKTFSHANEKLVLSGVNIPTA